MPTPLEMVTVRTSDLICPAIDWAVANCDGWSATELAHEYLSGKVKHQESPSTDWNQGGPIIERERISIVIDSQDGVWESAMEASTQSMFGFNGKFYSYGPTLLIAGMRCFVTSKMGPKVDIPKLLWTDAMPLLDSGAGNTPTKRNKP